LFPCNHDDRCRRPSGFYRARPVKTNSIHGPCGALSSPLDVGSDITDSYFRGGPARSRSSHWPLATPTFTIRCGSLQALRAWRLCRENVTMPTPTASQDPARRQCRLLRVHSVARLRRVFRNGDTHSPAEHQWQRLYAFSGLPPGKYQSSSWPWRRHLHDAGVSGTLRLDRPLTPHVPGNDQIVTLVSGQTVLTIDRGFIVPANRGFGGEDSSHGNRDSGEAGISGAWW